MLNDKEAYDIAKIYKQIEAELIDDMMKNFSRHRAEETKEGYNWEQWQVLQLQALEEFKERSAKWYGIEFKKVGKRIKGAITNANQQGGAEAEKKILRALMNNKKAVRQGSNNFFQINDRRVFELINATTMDFKKAEVALLRQANDQYRKIIFKTQLQASTGSVTYEKAVDLATKDFLTHGIQCIQYKNGAMHTISNYAKMAMRTSMKRAYLQGEGTKRDYYGVHTVIVNHRNHACSKCLPFVGKVLIDDVYSGGNSWEAHIKNLPLLSEAIDAGFLHPNCKDGVSTYFEGISDKPKPVTKQEKAYAEAYEEMANNAQQARNKADAFRRLAEYALDPQDKRMYLAKMAEWEQKAEQMEQELDNMPALYETAPPIKRPPIRQEIPLDKYTTYKGLIEIDPNWLQVYEEDSVWNDGTKIYYAKEPKKRLEIPWNSLTKSTQLDFRWENTDRWGKPFYIQKKDIDGRMLMTGEEYNNRRYARHIIKELSDKGYELKWKTDVWKYNRKYDLLFFVKDDKMFMVIDDVEETKAISPKAIKAIGERQKKVSKMLWDKKVHFSDLTYRQGDNWVQAMKEFHTVMEADLPVSWVTEAEYDSIEGDTLLRGIAGQSHLRSDITSGGLTPRDMAEQLMKGGVADCFPSRGVYGDCIAYVSNNERLAYEYATGYNRSDHGFIAEMKLKRDARGITYDEARELFEALNATELTAGNDPYFSKNQRRLTRDVEVGKAMQLLGYDYIIERSGDSTGIPFYMILNRDALVACPTRWIRNGDVRIGWKNYDRY